MLLIKKKEETLYISFVNLVHTVHTLTKETKCLSVKYAINC